VRRQRAARRERMRGRHVRNAVMLRLVWVRVALRVELGIIALVLAVLPNLAHADDWSLHVLGSGLTSWSDNVFSRPDEPIPDPSCTGDPACPPLEKEADLFYQVRPGALFSYETARMIHELDYTLDGTFYTVHSEQWSLAHNVAWRGFFLTSPRSEMTTGLIYSIGQLHTFALRTAANAGKPTAQLGGAVDYVEGTANQGFTYALSRQLRLIQTAQARRFETKDDTNTTSTGTETRVTLGLERAWRANALGLIAGSSFVDLSRLEPKPVVPGEPPPDPPNAINTDRSVEAQLTATWRRDIGERWTSVLDGGAVLIVPIEEGDQLTVRPTVGGQLSYVPDWGSAGLAVRRSVVPDLQIAQNTISDEVSVNCWLPLPWLSGDAHEPTFSFQATVAGHRTRILNLETDDTDQSFDVLLADGALDWHPGDAYHVSVRYQFQRQDADSNMETGIYDFARHSVMFAVSARWPDRIAAQIPVRGGVRVDRSDTTPVGEEAPSQDEASGVQKPR